MKKIYNLLLLTAALTLSLTGCSEDDPFTTAGPDDTPRFLAPSSIEGGVQISEDLKCSETFTMNVVVTPADYTTIEWICDGEVLGTGASFSKQFEAGEYELTILAKTVAGKQAYRKVILSVSPGENDPVASDKVMERYQEAGATITLSGTKMGNIKKVKINGRLIDVTSATEESIQYTIPADMPDGKYRMSMIDADGNSYGAGYVNISGLSIVSEYSFMGASSGQVTLKGRKLDGVASVTVDGQTCTIVSKTYDEMVIQLPALADGSYTLKATTKNGVAMMFVKDGSLVDAATILVAKVIVEQSEFIGMSAGQFTMTGINLNDISFVTVGGKACTIVSQEAGQMVVQLPELEEGSFDVKGTTTSGTTVKFLKDDQFVEVASIRISTIAEDILWQGNWAVDWGTIWEDNGTVTAELKKLAKPRAILRLYVKRTDTEYAKGCAAVGWADIVKGGVDPNRGDVNINFEDTYVDFVLTNKSMELINSGNLQVVGHGFNVTKITIIQPSEEELWAGKHAIDWGTIWEDNGTVTSVLKGMAGVGSVLRLYVKRTADDYCIGCAAVGWADIVKGGVDPNRGDVTINFEDTYVDFKFTEKSMELLNGGNLQVVGHGFDLLKITIQ
ncbi:MAG: IPT/TIG domain-containing protein [Prevotella sp.]|nr:IPT/TIG domain-containing protein [Prevotella sp.]